MAELLCWDLEIMDNLSAVLSGLVLPHIHNSGSGMMILILVLNVGISFFNAYVCGRSWEESKAVGGILWLVVWCTAIQSALGFSSVVLLFLIYLAHDYVPAYFTDVYFKGALNLWHLTIIFPIIGAGLSVTIESWVAVYRDASLLRLSNAAWNTFAQVRNTASAVENMGGALSSAGDPFKFTSDAEDDGKDAGLAILFSLVSLALLGGSVITAAIIRFYSGTVPLPDRDISYWLIRNNRVHDWNNII
ncbi:MAG TPA: hypothetical protein VE111_08020 [Bradyrhizobium sp.]|nr:hypothetical protein [Bradyrhizobium sp.]